MKNNKISKLNHILNLLFLVLKAHGCKKDSQDTIVIEAVVQSGMAMLLYVLKDHFKHFVIVGHPSTLIYCQKVFGKSYGRKVAYLGKINHASYKKAAIISDSKDKNCDLYTDFDYYNTEKREYIQKSGKGIIIPYYRSPARHYAVYKEGTKDFVPVSARIFFAGALPSHGYPLLKSVFPELMNRTQVVDALYDVAEKHSEENNGKREVYIAVKDTRRGVQTYPIDFADFERQLAVCDFFIAPPGNGMPHCHNIMEALKAGCVPITNYAGWFYPPLEVGKNCFVFNDETSLKKCIEKALSFSEEEIRNLKENARNYYEKYCSAESVYENLRAFLGKRSQAMFLVNDEGNSIRLHKENSPYRI